MAAESSAECWRIFYSRSANIKTELLKWLTTRRKKKKKKETRKENSVCKPNASTAAAEMPILIYVFCTWYWVVVSSVWDYLRFKYHVAFLILFTR